MQKLLNRLYIQHNDLALKILKAIHNRFEPGNPPRLFLIKSDVESQISAESSKNSQKTLCEKEFKKTIDTLKAAGYILLNEQGVIGLTEKGKTALSKYQEFELLTNTKKAEIIIRENFVSIIALFSLIISILSLIISLTKK